MDEFSIGLLIISFLGLLVLFCLQYIRVGDVRLLGVRLIVLAIVAVFFNIVFSISNVEAKSANDLLFVAALYLFMLLGMLSHFAYHRFENPKRDRHPFDFGTFIAPIFASPIVFIPLLAALQNANVNLNNLDSTRIMVFLVAFENGFFWKDYFDHRREKKSEEKHD